MDFSTFYQEKIAPLYDSYFDYNLYESLAKKKYELLAMVATIIAICVGVFKAKGVENALFFSIAFLVPFTLFFFYSLKKHPKKDLFYAFLLYFFCALF